MKALPLLKRGLPALLGLLCASCQQQDGQVQARLADAEARAKQAEAAVTELKKKVAEAPPASVAPSGSDPAEAADLRKKIAALEEENHQLQELAAKAKAVQANPLAGIDAKAIENSFVNGFLEKKKEWKDALSDYQVKGYEQPEVTVEDVKPFRTSIGIKLEQGGRAFTAQVPVTADFQGNWSFPSADEVVGFAKQAAAGNAAPAATSAPSPGPAPAPDVAKNSPSAPPAPTPAPPKPEPKPDVPESVPFGGKNLIKLPPIKFPGDP
ncbi:MAG: hypothetical protein JWL81_430 [Verrucomicrobiales bacterium]|nr:hypothetical protein [Verrucomicrobiales bacterium]